MKPIYLDYQATTPLAPEAAAAMRPWLEDKFGNPHSPHRPGREAAAAVEVARGQVLDALLYGNPVDPPGGVNEAMVMLGRPPSDFEPESGRLFFTSGATEALNWAIKGSFSPGGKRRKIVTAATEHAAVLDTVHSLAAHGAEIVVLPVDPDGYVRVEEGLAAIDDSTALLALMLVNNEIGIIQEEALTFLSNRARDVGARVLCDAVQGFGRQPVPVGACDLIAISAHKVHGPKGIGALWVRKGAEPEPLMHGGGQEQGLRSGTLSPALCVGFGAAVTGRSMSDDLWHIGKLFKRARAALGPEWLLNGGERPRWSGNLNIRRPGIDAARLISDVRQVAFSAGSACASGSGRPSHVLRAIGLSDAEARSSIRLGFGRYTSEEDLLNAIHLINEAAERQLRFAA